jgi:hypothetical protein
LAATLSVNATASTISTIRFIIFPEYSTRYA